MGSFDFKKLEYMIDMAKKVEDNKISEYDASVKVGTVLVKDFVIDK